MKNLFLFAALLFIVACAQQPAPMTPDMTGQPQTPVNDTAPDPEPVAPVQVVESRDVATIYDGLPADVQDILANGERNAAERGFSYTLNMIEGTQQSSHPAQGAMVYQKDMQLKMVLDEPSMRVDPAEYFNIVLLDLENGTALGHCNDRTRCDDEIGGRGSQQFDTYVFMTPSDWIHQMEDPVRMEERTVQNRVAVRLDAYIDERVASIWIDRFSGLPVLVEHAGTTYDYQGFSLGVKDSDMTVSE